MPRRGPDGKFVSGGGTADMPDVFSGRLSITIPAADLSGGTQTQAVNGSAAEIIDFTNYLDSGEVFHAELLEAGATLAMPTTATAESAARVAWEIRSALADGTVPGRPSHYGGGQKASQGIADINQNDSDDDDIMAIGHLEATAGYADSVNGLGGGSDNDRDRFVLPASRDFDQDDEVTVPHYINVDNASDHAVVVGFDVRLAGRIEEDC